MRLKNIIKNESFKGNNIVLKIKARTGKSKNLITGIMPDGTVKIDIAAIPENGRANKELISFLAKEFDVAHENVKIFSGGSSKYKLIKIIR